jgi:hypothetical protein
MEIKDGKVLNLYDKLVDLVRENKLEEALLGLENSENCKELLMNYVKIRNNLIELNSKVNPKVCKSKYSQGDYEYPQEILK